MNHSELDPAGQGASRARAGDVLVVEVEGSVVQIPAATILEIMNPTPATPLPGAPPSVRGVVNYRGTPTPVVDLARALGHEGVREEHRLIVLRWNGREIALAVDDVLALSERIENRGSSLRVDLDTLLGSIF